MAGNTGRRGWRALDLDGQALLFDRRTGTNMLVTNASTAALRRSAPRMLQVALTNACDKTCSFCYRPLEAKSRWTFDDLLDLARVCDAWGVLEIAFGGGEPTLFPRFAELLRAIWSETGLCPSFTTNGLRLRKEFLREIRGAYGQLQVSVYDEDDTFAIIDLLVGERARFGLNYLVTPKRVRSIEADVFAFMDRGVRDILFLSYKGSDSSLHLSAYETRVFDESLAKLHDMLGQQVALKVDVCWAGRLVRAPQLLNESDCQANIDFLSITSDKKVLSCSFSEGGIPFGEVSEIRAIYETLRSKRIAAQSPGCARLPAYGFPRTERAARSLPVIQERV
jgi:MoaA/NifB/PqqE/SkfB family radical SAM enzyme